MNVFLKLPAALTDKQLACEQVKLSRDCGGQEFSVADLDLLAALYLSGGTQYKQEVIREAMD
jgi:hypothetical protein